VPVAGLYGGIRALGVLATMSRRPPPASVLITGATGGIGRALALHYASAGRTLILHGRDAAKMDALTLDCTQRGARVLALLHDVTDTGGWMNALDKVASATPIDLAIVNAGATHIIRNEGESWADIERVLNTNLRAALATTSALLPHMQKRGGGQIALISSLSAWYGVPVSPAYSASKAALKNYGEAMRAWLAPRNIAVSVVLPGFVKSAMSDQFPTGKPFMLSAEDAARRIAHGLARNQARISFPMLLSVGTWFLAVLPASISQRLLQWLGFSREK